ncbi:MULTISPECIES: thiol reductant ABC exporter subunit CydC [Pelosinus]|uniref:ABC transporter, CydDC cysteine exporter (CydDC-E) family, permease/ATP-binding protein CydC n=1 Tax=Pelosinus fermentans B4 TaxID=1149862 RepID=I9ASA3_9FIRM|nr:MULTISPECIES: thiol reductant ABC exporter subunit CydC [Pelosinus]EIW15817.1 ABC transporter, CydDC cysteine exporter (CydDC-E) family, permease/ATP-binding protein CydC [Pelosinus fermentans B4]EIW27477.1 ABC transporter, CydDC cysteine exporter (CydDC-E) family, permease/ATP-binding protein CydC [Pelosinus fermentans A11]OAM92565.1 ABC transporter, CydDC cysteine exporter (CydDC-E) family, permease/ATP-binding protein CydC [Pelosinus fermentans DSM 17108]SDQ49147.1 ATP-binding cassette, s
MSIFLRLLQIMGSSWRTMVMAGLFGFLTVGSNIGLMAASAYLISGAALHPSITELSIAIVGVRFFGIARAIFRYLERYVSHDATFRLLGTVRVWFYTKLEGLAPARLLEWRSGELFSAIVSDVETLKEFYLRVLAPPFIAILVVVGTCLFLAQFNLVFVYVLTGGGIFLGVLLPLAVSRVQKSLAEELVTARMQMKAQLVDSITGIVELAAFGQTHRQAQNIAELDEELAGIQGKVVNQAGMIDALGLFIVNATVWLVLWFAIPLVHSGQLEGIYLAVVALTVQSSFEAVLPLPLAVHFLAESMAAARRLFGIVDRVPAVIEQTEGILTGTDGTLTVKDLSFRYRADGAAVLRNISFTAASGQSVAIVGPSGAGKSTLLYVLLRFWEYEEGSILLGSHELKKYQSQNLRTMFSVVSQQSHMFNASIRDNILLAKPDASEAEFEQVIENSELTELLKSLPQGSDTMVGQNGFALSGGQRQRIAIARALLRNAPILILDEPTVGLDSLTEEAVMGTLAKLMAGRTTILITHRLTGLKHMDTIFVLEAGRIIEQGTQEELLKNEGLFYQLWHLQHDVV